MSTINSFFNSRKSRSNNNNNGNKTSNAKLAPLNNFAAQAPQPIYENVIKPTANNKKSSQKESINKRNSILHYLSPIKTVVEEESTIAPCTIRLNIPVSLVWRDILEEFDPGSHTNQLIQDFPIEEMMIEEMEVCSSIVNRRRKLEDDENGTRNIRIRTAVPSTYTLLNQSFTLLEEYLLQDIQEDLSRPLRKKYPSKQTNIYLSEIVNEILILSDNRWIQSYFLLPFVVSNTINN